METAWQTTTGSEYARIYRTQTRALNGISDTTWASAIWRSSSSPVDEGVTAVENALEQLLGTPRGVVSAKDAREVLDAWRDLEREWRERPPLPVSLSVYDALLDGGGETGMMLEEVVA